MAASTSQTARHAYRGRRPPTKPLQCAWVVLVTSAEAALGALVTSGTLETVGTRHTILYLPAVGLAEDTSLKNAVDEKALLEYDKILVVGPRVVFVANADDLFELEAPACYSRDSGSQQESLRTKTSAGNAIVLLDPRSKRAQEFFRDSAPFYWKPTISPHYLAVPWLSGPTRDLRALAYPTRHCECEEPYPSVWRQAVERVARNRPEVLQLLARLPAGEHEGYVSPLDADLAQLRLTDELVQLILQRGTEPGSKTTPGQLRADFQQREAGNILERWLLAMVNSPGDEDDRIPWAKVYRRSSYDDDFNNKLAGELLEKHFVKTDTQAGTLVGEMLALVNLSLSRGPPPSHGPVTCSNLAITYRSFSWPITPRIAQLIALCGCEAALAVVLRYAVLPSSGHQWGLPQAHIDYLYDKFRVRGEGFASPLNSRLLGKPGAVICSAFPDTDAAFGCTGDFFSHDLRTLDGNWYVNPPFIEHILSRAAHYVLDLLSPDRPQTIFFVVPAWTDSEAYAALHNSQYRAAELRLEPGHYYYEDPRGHRVDTKATSIYFALSTEPAAIRASLGEALRHVLA